MLLERLEGEGAVRSHLVCLGQHHVSPLDALHTRAQLAVDDGRQPAPVDGADALDRALGVVVVAIDGPHTDGLLVERHQRDEVNANRPDDPRALAKLGLV